MTCGGARLIEIDGFLDGPDDLLSSGPEWLCGCRTLGSSAEYITESSARIHGVTVLIFGEIKFQAALDHLLLCGSLEALTSFTLKRY